MQIVSLGDNLHEIAKPFFLGNKTNVVSLSSVVSAQSVLKVESSFQSDPV